MGVEVNGAIEAVKYARIVDGVDCCNVEFVQRFQAKRKSIGSFVVVQECYYFLNNKFKKDKSNKNRGMVG
jgi:hypothetical protein